MNKLKSLFLVFALLIATPAFALDAPSNIGEIKSVRGARQSEATRVFKQVRYAERGANANSISADAVVVYDTISDDGITVALTTTSADARVAGVVVTTIQTADSASASASEDEGKRNWGYILVHGPTTVNSKAGGTNAASIGDPLVTSTDAGTATTFETMSTYPANLSKKTSGRFGFFMDAGDGSTTSYDAYINVE